MKHLALILLIASGCTQFADPENDNAVVQVESVRDMPKGNLFIIGGGSRPDAMIQRMVELSLCDTCYALIFADASAEPDSAFYFIAKQIKVHTSRPVLLANTDSLLLTQELSLVRGAALIFITGGDQNRFLNAVDSTVQQAIHDAYHQGATIAGTSAGAALMSEVMITGDQRRSSEYESTYSTLVYGNGVYTQGLGLLKNAIIDQHFVARSRYNRLLSALADTGLPEAFGIEESTALLIAPNYCTVIGERQVVQMYKPASFTERNGRIGFREMKMNIYLEGDTFLLNQKP